MKFEFESEAKLHKAVVESIVGEEFTCLVADDARLTNIWNRVSENQFPQFSIDHLCRLSAADAGATVLGSLDCLELLSSDQNISITASQILRPDIVCINPESESIVIIELKKTKQTGRQALTELLAYEQEVKNLLPFLTNYDVFFILISPEWSTLMDHAVAAAIMWSQKKILCLEAEDCDTGLVLRTRLPLAWEVTGSVYFPEDALASVTVCLCEKDGRSSKQEDNDDPSKKTEEYLDRRLLTALDVMAREGDRMGSHGFALLWEDHWESSLTRYNITICGVSPFSFYKSSRMRGIIESDDGKLVDDLDNYVSDFDPQGHSGSLMAVAKIADPILREISDPHLEGFSTWEEDQISLRSRAEPIRIEFWGALGDSARTFVLHPAIRLHRRNSLLGGEYDWHDPRVGLPLVKELTKPKIFYEGQVRCSDAYRFGVLFGLDRALRSILRDQMPNPSQKTFCRFRWNRIDLMAAIEEIRALADSAENVDAPNEPLKFYEDFLADDEGASERFLEWLTEDFFQLTPPHIAFFILGAHGAGAFDHTELGIVAEPVPDEHIENIAKELQIATHLVLSRFRQLQEEDGFWGELEGQYRALLRALGLRKNFAWKTFGRISALKLFDAWPVCLKSSDYILDNVFHRHAPIADTEIDWDWLKQGVDGMRKRGIPDAGVVLLANGQLATGPVLPPGFKINLEIDDPNEQVPFMDHSRGIGHMQITTWTKLRSGSHFRRPEK